MAVGSFCNTDSDEEELRAQAKLQIPTHWRTEWAKANPRQVFGEEINVGVKSSLSVLNLLPAEGISAKQPPEDVISQNLTRPDWASAAKIRGENHLGSHDSNTGYPKESDQSSSARHLCTPPDQTLDVWQFTERDTKITEELFATWPEPPEDTCLWVDSYILRYTVLRNFTRAWKVWMHPLTVLKRPTSWGYCGLKWNLLRSSRPQKNLIALVEFYLELMRSAVTGRGSLKQIQIWK